MSQIEAITVQVKNWITGHFPLANELDIGPADSLLESGIVDSLGTLDIVLYLEQHFGLVVEDEEVVADHFESIEAISSFVVEKLKP